MKILFIGPPACGKGTQGELLSDFTGWPVVSMGQVLREVPSSHEWYETINAQMKQGILVDQDKAAALLQQKLSTPEYKDNFILDGWFRSIKDVRLYDPGFDKAVFINIDHDEIVKRMSSRRVCSQCGDVYNLISNPPKKPDICDECGGKLEQRNDDKEETVRERIKSFEDETQEVLGYLNEKGILVEVDGVGSIEEVFERVKKALNI